MKNFIKLFGIIALVAVIGFSMVSCGDDDGGGGSSLTITDLPSDQEGKYVGEYTSNLPNGDYLFAYAEKKDSELYESGDLIKGELYGGLIKDGKVTLKVYSDLEDTDYRGSDANVTFYLIFKDTATEKINFGTDSKTGKVTVTFNKGVGSGAYTE